MKRYLADTHVHTNYSFDSDMKIPDIIARLEELKLKYVMLSDHVEFAYQYPEEVIHRLEMRNDEIDKLQKKTKLKIIKAIEVSEPHLYKAELEAVRDQIELDCVIGSIHHLLGMPLKKIAHMHNIYDIYLDSMLNMVTDADIDIVAHLDYVKKYNMQQEFEKEKLETVLKEIIDNNLVLEVNTHTKHMDEHYPSTKILEQYAELGGKKVSIGSDAHKKSELYNKIATTSEELDQYGFAKGLVIEKSFRKI